jgi:hypothetical protein
MGDKKELNESFSPLKIRAGALKSEKTRRACAAVAMFEKGGPVNLPAASCRVSNGI